MRGADATSDAMRALAVALAPFLRELGYEPAPVAAVTYTRTNLPPGYASAEAFASTCRRLRLDRNAYRHGRSWRVPAHVWELARREDKAKRRAPVAGEVVDDADAMLRSSGLRLLRGRRP